MRECGQNESFTEHYRDAPKNATYRSKTTQNELISICGQEIIKKLIHEIKGAKNFSVLADEPADVSNTEQMAIVIRFVDTNENICEVFMGYTTCDEGLSGKAIAKKIIDTISELSLEMENCRGQGYDGAGNMAGKCSGAAVRIQHSYPQALYVHCRAHVLNLCVASACKIQVVKNMMGHARVVSEFFNAHPKRFGILTKKIKSSSISS